jgi:hypothetical protein
MNRAVQTLHRAIKLPYWQGVEALVHLGITFIHSQLFYPTRNKIILRVRKIYVHTHQSSVIQWLPLGTCCQQSTIFSHHWLCLVCRLYALPTIRIQIFLRFFTNWNMYRYLDSTFVLLYTASTAKVYFSPNRVMTINIHIRHILNWQVIQPFTTREQSSASETSSLHAFLAPSVTGY